MKNIQSILNILFLVCILVLFYLLLNNDNVDLDKEQNGTENKFSNSEVGMEGTAIDIRYVNTDSIWLNFDYVDEIRKRLESRQLQYKKELEGKIRNFEAEVKAFQEKAANMSRFEGEQKQKELIQEEQKLQQLQEELSVKLVEEEEKMKLDLRKRILDHLEGYKMENVDLILDYSNSGSVLLASDSLNITSEVLTALNEDYAKQKEVK